MSRRHRPQLTLLPASPLLITESDEEFDRIGDALNQEIKPQGIVEQIYVADIAYLTWEILRLRRCKAAIINSGFRAALEEILKQVLREPGGYAHQVAGEAEDLAHGWFSDPAVKKQVSELLSEFRLDESAVEAEAIKSLAEVLEQIDRLLASLESRRNKALRCITDYRDVLARQLQESSNRIIDGKVLSIEHDSRKKPSTAA